MYSKRIWIDEDPSPSTRAVMAYHGPIKYEPGREDETTTFLKISTCHNQVHFHRTYDETIPQYVEKLELLRDAINNFIEHLKEEE